MMGKRFRIVFCLFCVLCMGVSLLENGIHTMAESSFDSINSVEYNVDTDVESSSQRDSGITVSTNLDDFMTEVIIDARVDENGNYIINPNMEYDMTFRFSENENVQFDNEGVLVYELPEGVIINDFGATAFTIKVVDENGSAVVYDNLFEVVDGKLRVYFNQDDPNFERLKATPNVNFELTFSSSFDENTGEIVFTPNIIKDFVFEEKADITINKTVSYNIDNDKAYYEVKIRSEGLNENLVVEDTLTGTALIFNQDVVVESSLNGILSVVPDYSSIENGFRVTIPQTVNGEVLTFRYSAEVDNTKISGNGTVEQTNNIARVTSDQMPDGKEASANFAGQADFQRVAKRPVGEPIQVGENHYEQTWKIRVNEDHKMQMGGTYIYDWITTNSRPFMLFNGAGLTVNVTFENGSTETRIVPWSELYIWESSTGTYGWRYMTPDSDGKASYEITCTTLINSEGALGELTLVNGAQVYNSYDEGKTSVGQIGENTLTIKKEAKGTNSAESEWKITVTVPGSGLPEMHIVDDVPKLVYDGQNYIDYLIEDSVEVEGLLEGETWKLSLNSDRRSFTVTFYKSEIQNNANKGVLPTPDGTPRDIVIRLKTSVNQEWLDLAEANGYTSTTLSRHRNYTCAWSGAYRTETVNAEVYPIRPNMVKNFVERTDVEIDGVTYPVFRYSLLLLGPTADGIVIHDSFNTEYLRYYESDGICILGGNNQSPTDSNGEATVTETAYGIDVNVNSFPKNKDNQFYPYYLVKYSLVVKNAEILAAMNEEAAMSQNGISLENTASWEGITSNRTVNYTYFPYVDKELTDRPTADNGYIAEFKVVINKYAEDLDPTTDELTILDELSSNLRFIPDSVSISPRNDAIAVQHDSETNTLVISNVPDETAFEITYKARVLGSGNVSYSNTVKFGKYEKTVEETATVVSSGGGTASNPSITVVKRDGEVLSKVLAGATFQLYYLSNGSEIPVTDKNGDSVIFVTNDEGKALIIGHLQNLGWTLWAGRTYFLKEITAPVGYELNEDPIYFVLTDNPASQTEYDLTGDILNVQNELIKTTISVTKQWVGPPAEAVTVNLISDGTVISKAVLSEDNNWTYTFADLPKYDTSTGREISYEVQEEDVPGYQQSLSGNVEEGFVLTNTITGKISVPVSKKWVGPETNQVTVELFAGNVKIDEAVLNADNNWQHTFADLDQYNNGSEIKYTIHEVGIDGYSAVITEDQNGYIITNTNTETIDIPVVKKWIGPIAEEEYAVLTVALLADGEQVDEIYLSFENNYSSTFTGKAKYSPVDGHEIEYAVSEVNVPEGYEASISESPEGGFVITNTNVETIDIPVTKQWVGPAAEEVTVSLLANDEVMSETVLNKNNDWKHTFTDLPKYDQVTGEEIRYEVKEAEVQGYHQELTGSVEEGFTFINTITGKISVDVTKRWIGPAAESVTVELLANGVKAAEAVLSETGNWEHTFTDLDQYSNGEEIVYTIREVSLEGYSAEITGDHNSYLITNTNIMTTEVTVTKQWIGPGAESVTAELLADGIKAEEITLNAENNWTYTFTELPKYDSIDGHEIIYSVNEATIDGYDSAVSGNTADGFVITNTNTETIDIPVTKQWVGPAAESVTISLLANGEVVEESLLNDDNGWTHTFEGLPKYDSISGEAIGYTVSEQEVSGYQQGLSGTAETGFTITNTITGKVSIPVTKQWIGPSAENVTVELLADSIKIDEIVLSEDNNWQYTFTDLEKYSNGTEIIYTVQEISVEGYSSVITGDQNGYVITNTNTETIDIPVEKKWVGLRGKAVTIKLLADGNEISDVILNDVNNWQHSFIEMPKYSDEDGHEIVYTVSEDPIEGYTAVVAGDAENGFVITNTSINIPDTGDSANLMTYVITFILSGICSVWMAIYARKEYWKV